jgi:tetratricopeptide (TPR) repeat protein
MRLQLSARIGVLLISAAGVLAWNGCQPREPEPAALPLGPDASRKALSAAPVEPLKNEILSDALVAVAKAHFKGLGYMEQYKYPEAADCFREVHRLAPGWIPGSINLAIALLNQTGVSDEQTKNSRTETANSTIDFSEALALLAGVIDRFPDDPHAHYCRGIILEQQGRLPEAHHHFQRVVEIDPNDATSWYWLAATVNDPERPDSPDLRKLARQQIPLLQKALDCDPYLTPAIYKLQQAFRLTAEPKKAAELLAKWQELNQDRPKPSPGPGNMVEKNYGNMGRYANVVDPFPRQEPTSSSKAMAPRFDACRSIDIKLEKAERWVKPADFTGSQAVMGRARARFGAAVAVFDVNGDGRLDLFLAAAVVGPSGVRDALLLNQGDGRFEDATAAFGLPMDHASLGVAAADFDADRHIDLFLTGVGNNRLFRNRDGKKYEDVSSSLRPLGPPAVSLTARWLDLDQDGDLDLYVVNYCVAAYAPKAFAESTSPPQGVANWVYRNDGQPEPIPSSPAPAWAPLAVAWNNVRAKAGLSIALNPWTTPQALSGRVAAHTGIAALDIDGDRDLDLVTIADAAAPVAILNDRLGQFHEFEVTDFAASRRASGLLVTDLDADGRPDLVVPSAQDRLTAWRNTTERKKASETKVAFEPWPVTSVNWRTASAIDLDLDGLPDLLGLPAPATKPAQLPIPVWARNEGMRLTAENLPIHLESSGFDAASAVDLVGDPLLDLLVVRWGEPPALAANLGNGQNWLALHPGGHWRVKPELMRSNSHGIGARVLVEGLGLHVVYDHTTPESGLGQSICPIVVGLGNKKSAELVHILWPDGVMQCEFITGTNKKIDLAENNRKTGSCPVLFTWNGRRFVCIGDFLGGGGLGYLVAPGVYSQPDRDESVAISGEQLQPEQGVFRLSVTEPMDEVAYLDQLQLDVVDRPSDVSAAPDERFAPSGPRPTGKIMAWRTAIEPVHATDLGGRDMTETLRNWDRRTVDTFRKLGGLIGYAEDHGIILDFGERLSRFHPADRLVLCLAGWVEYPYSQTNYAAATAGITLKPPTIERRRDDGSWQVIEPHAGYPAGLPRLATLDLTGKLNGPRCVLRIKTNMECYYDQAFIALRDRAAETSLQVATLPVARAVLGYRGYMREISPDGQPPLIYDYDYIDPAPLARLSGKLTRYGDVSRLLQADDDFLCVVGPGDEVRLEFEASGLRPLPAGWTRSYVLRACGYCKDADLFTAKSDSVEPLPWRKMPAFPFGPEVKRHGDATYQSYVQETQTRPAGGGD